MKAGCSHEGLAEPFYQVRREKLFLSGKPGSFMGIIEPLDRAARETGSSSVLSGCTHIINDVIKCFSNS